MLSFEYRVSHRVVVPELMDDPSLPRPEHERALMGLARLNRWSRSDSGTWAVLQKLPQPLRVLDLACGSGDLVVRLALKARSAKLDIAFSGCDISPTAIEAAKRHAAFNGVQIEWLISDVLRDPLPGGYNVIMCSLFLHHLSQAQALHLLRSMAEATVGRVLMNDLDRSRFNLGVVTVATRLLSRSPIVHHDGPASVRAAFTVAEARTLAEKAGLASATVEPQFPCRWLLNWTKPA